MTQGAIPYEYRIIDCAFLLPPQEDNINLPHDKIPGKTGENSEPKKHGYPNHPRWKSLLNMIFCSKHSSTNPRRWPK